MMLVCLVLTFLYSVQCYACFVPLVWLSLLLCIFAHLPTYSCMSPCLLVSSRLIPTILCGFTPIFDTRDPESHIGSLLDGTCVVHTPISWNYGHPIQTYICSPRIALLFDSMFVCPHLALFDSVPLYMFSMPLYYLICSFSGCFLHFLHVHAWSEYAWSDGMTS